MLSVHSIETFSTNDGPGIRLVVFIQGCNFRCLYCQNPDTQPLTSNKAKRISSKAILKTLQNQKPYFKNQGGLTISGGEPLLQANKIIKLFKLVKAHGFHTAIDTNGSIFSSTSKKLFDLADLVILDVKHINNTWHQKLTGASNINVLKSAGYREATKKPMWLRYVLVPGFTDQQKYIHQWGQHFQPYKTIEKVEIIPYHTLGLHKYTELGQKNPLPGTKPPTKHQTQTTKEILSKYFKNVFAR